MRASAKTVTAIVGVSVTNAGTATGEAIDCAGYDHCIIHVGAATANVVSNKPTVLKVQESAITDATGFADVSGAIGGTDFTVANSLTSLPNNYQFSIDTRARKRYLRVLVSPATTQIVYGSAILLKAHESPSTAAKAGVLNLVAI